MTAYSFTCPIEGCGQTLTTDKENKEEAVHDLVEKAKQHLKEAHPDIIKTDEEVEKDIRSGMVEIV